MTQLLLNTANTEDKILDYFMQGNSLTTKECQQIFGTSELRHYVSRINKRGYFVTGEWIKVVVCNTAKSVKRYRIEA